jgi:hypothetical protein
VQAEQLVGPLFQPRPAGVFFRERGELTLHPNQLGPRTLAVFLQPVSVNEPGRIILGGLLDCAEEARLVIHGKTFL